MKTNNNFDMLGLIVALLLSDSFSASVESLSDTCNLPIPQMRKYLSIIFDNKAFLTHLSPTPYFNEDDNDPLTTSQDFLKKIASGNADEEEIYLIDMEDFIGDYHLLPITSIEAGYVSNIYPNLLQNQRTNLFEIKDTPDLIPKVIWEKQDKIQEAIAQKRKIEFKYKPPGLALSRIVCSPVSVIQNLTTHLLYIKDSENTYYRIDRIKSNIRILADCSDIDQYQPSSYQKYFWGTESQVHDDPIHVKLRILAGTANIIEKIKSDTALRNETSKLYQEGDYYYYEDDILGIQDFRRWLRSYGSSITVLEPQSLINEITESALRTLSYYKKLNSINT